MQELGMTTLGMDKTFMEKYIYKAIPDMFGKKDAEIAKTPPFVQYLKCEDKIEKGDRTSLVSCMIGMILNLSCLDVFVLEYSRTAPLTSTLRSRQILCAHTAGCDANKYNDTVCASRKFKASWHPGWKYHALVGNLIAITQLDALEDALQGFVDVEKDLDLKDETLADQKTRLTNQLNDLSSQEGKDYNNIFNSPIPEKLQPHLERWWGDAEGKAEHLSDMELEAFFKMPSFCHTGMLPAEIRFQGLLTENSTNVGTIWDQNYDSVNKYDQVQRFEYDKRNASYSAEYKDPRPEKDGQIMLVEASEDRGDDCEVYTHLDFKDHFYISSREGVRTLTLPNNAEKKYYTEYDATKAKGYILMCLKPVSTIEGMFACCKERCLFGSAFLTQLICFFLRPVRLGTMSSR